MDTLQQFYINGSWVSPAPGATTHAVINPANEEQIATLPLAQAADIDAAIFVVFAAASHDDRAIFFFEILDARKQFTMTLINAHIDIRKAVFDMAFCILY